LGVDIRDPREAAERDRWDKGAWPASDLLLDLLGDRHHCRANCASDEPLQCHVHAETLPTTD
jgi:hypothetical protein